MTCLRRAAVAWASSTRRYRSATTLDSATCPATYSLWPVSKLNPEKSDTARRTHAKTAQPRPHPRCALMARLMARKQGLALVIFCCCIISVDYGPDERMADNVSLRETVEGDAWHAAQNLQSLHKP